MAFAYKRLSPERVRQSFTRRDDIEVFLPDYVFCLIDHHCSREQWVEHRRELKAWAFERFGPPNNNLVRTPGRAGYAVSGASFITHDPNMAFEFKMRWF